MIIDTMDHLAFYDDLLPHAAALAKHWQMHSAEGAPVEIRDKRYDTKPDHKRRFEVHAHTIDLMIGFEGSEIIHICDQTLLAPAEALPGGADGMKMDGAPQGHAICLLPGTFVAIYPGEAHMVGGQTTPGVAQPLHKWVVKIPLAP